jgi:hypothetical protein
MGLMAIPPRGAQERSPRRDTRLEAEGAEFLVLGSLLAEGIPAWKAYTNFPGYDILAGDPTGQRTCRIQVKSAFWTGSRTWQIRSFDCDFVCCVRLNRGYRGGPRVRAGDGKKAPDIFVFPRRVARRAYEETELGWASISLGRMRDAGQYLQDWKAISEFLRAKRRAR